MATSRQQRLKIIQKALAGGVMGRIPGPMRQIPEPQPRQKQQPSSRGPSEMRFWWQDQDSDR